MYKPNKNYNFSKTFVFRNYLECEVFDISVSLYQTVTYVVNVGDTPHFEKYGINPVQHESPAKEMQKLIKRCDQVIAFIRKQEQDILRPACAAISTTEARIERVLDKLATAGQVRDLQKAVSDQQQRQNYDARNLRSDILQLLGRATEQERKAFMYLGKLVDAKEKSGFFNDIATLYKEQG